MIFVARVGPDRAVFVGPSCQDRPVTSWRDRLDALAHDRLPAELATAWTGLVRPGIRLVPAGAGPRVAWLGGDPHLPAETEWPAWPGHGPLNFVAAVDCAALPRAFLSVPLPAAGTLLFFHFDGYRRSARADSATVRDTGGSRVLFVPADVPVARRGAPEGVVPYPALEMSAEIVATAPEREHVLLDRTTTTSGATLTEAVEDAEELDEWGTDVFGELVDDAAGGGLGHHVGGFAAPVQGAVEVEVAAALLEGSWADPRLADEAARWVLLAEITSDEAADMVWGDAGSLYWLIRTDDLEAGRFEEARCTMQCG